MKDGYPSLTRDLLPPVLRRGANRLLGKSIRYIGPFPDWQAAVSRTRGYDDPTILERVESATRKVISGAAEYEQDGVAFATPAKPNAALAAVLLAGSLEKRLSVLDFGGSLGSHYLRWKSFLGYLPGTEWYVVEQQNYVARGRVIHSESGLPIRFHERIEDIGAAVNVAIASSVLQYLAHPLAILEAMVAAAPRVIVLDRTPFSRDDRERIMCQLVPNGGRQASYPIRLLSWPSISGLLDRNYALLSSFPCDDDPVRGRCGASYRGAIWLRRD
jgi:putative methyltransferase (TIGR04325 family)